MSPEDLLPPSPPSGGSNSSRDEAQAAADRLGVDLATGGRARGGLITRPKRKKPVAKKK